MEEGDDPSLTGDPHVSLSADVVEQSQDFLVDGPAIEICEINSQVNRFVSQCNKLDASQVVVSTGDAEVKCLEWASDPIRPTSDDANSGLLVDGVIPVTEANRENCVSGNSRLSVLGEGTLQSHLDSDMGSEKALSVAKSHDAVELLDSTSALRIPFAVVRVKEGTADEPSSVIKGVHDEKHQTASGKTRREALEVQGICGINHVRDSANASQYQALVTACVGEANPLSSDSPGNVRTNFESPEGNSMCEEWIGVNSGTKLGTIRGSPESGEMVKGEMDERSTILKEEGCKIHVQVTDQDVSEASIREGKNTARRTSPGEGLSSDQELQVKCPPSRYDGIDSVNNKLVLTSEGSINQSETAGPVMGGVSSHGSKLEGCFVGEVPASKSSILTIGRGPIGVACAPCPPVRKSENLAASHGVSSNQDDWKEIILQGVKLLQSVAADIGQERSGSALSNPSSELVVDPNPERFKRIIVTNSTRENFSSDCYPCAVSSNSKLGPSIEGADFAYDPRNLFSEPTLRRSSSLKQELLPRDSNLGETREVSPQDPSFLKKEESSHGPELAIVGKSKYSRENVSTEVLGVATVNGGESKFGCEVSKMAESVKSRADGIQEQEFASKLKVVNFRSVDLIDVLPVAKQTIPVIPMDTTNAGSIQELIVTSVQELASVLDVNRSQKFRDDAGKQNTCKNVDRLSTDLGGRAQMQSCTEVTESPRFTTHHSARTSNRIGGDSRDSIGSTKMGLDDMFGSHLSNDEHSKINKCSGETTKEMGLKYLELDASEDGVEYDERENLNRDGNDEEGFSAQVQESSKSLGTGKKQKLETKRKKITSEVAVDETTRGTSQKKITSEVVVDEITRGTSQNVEKDEAQAERHQSGGEARNDPRLNVGEPNNLICSCGIPAVLKMVGSHNQNRGLKYYSCKYYKPIHFKRKRSRRANERNDQMGDESHRGCGFYQWLDTPGVCQADRKKLRFPKKRKLEEVLATDTRISGYFTRSSHQTSAKDTSFHCQFGGETRASCSGLSIETKHETLLELSSKNENPKHTDSLVSTGESIRLSTRKRKRRTGEDLSDTRVLGCSSLGYKQKYDSASNRDWTDSAGNTCKRSRSVMDIPTQTYSRRGKPAKQASRSTDTLKTVERMERGTADTHYIRKFLPVALAYKKSKEVILQDSSEEDLDEDFQAEDETTKTIGEAFFEEQEVSKDKGIRFEKPQLSVNLRNLARMGDKNEKAVVRSRVRRRIGRSCSIAISSGVGVESMHEDPDWINVPLSCPSENEDCDDLLGSENQALRYDQKLTDFNSKVWDGVVARRSRKRRRNQAEGPQSMVRSSKQSSSTVAQQKKANLAGMDESLQTKQLCNDNDQFNSDDEETGPHGPKGLRSLKDVMRKEKSDGTVSDYEVADELQPPYCECKTVRRRAVLKTVLSKSPNYGLRYWVCINHRPLFQKKSDWEGDPNDESCKYFRWLDTPNFTYTDRKRKIAARWRR